jgi:deazaflavin-dependent oxidoreductase (nitroreductase family)
MVLPMRLARFNRHVTNRVTGLIAPWMPWFGVLHHTGRRSGRALRTPLNVFKKPDGFVIALTYGPDTDWVKNVLAANGCAILYRRRLYQLTSPRIYRDEHALAMPAIVRLILRRIGVTEFLELRDVT